MFMLLIKRSRGSTSQFRSNKYTFENCKAAVVSYCSVLRALFKLSPNFFDQKVPQKRVFTGCNLQLLRIGLPCFEILNVRKETIIQRWSVTFQSDRKRNKPFHLTSEIFDNFGKHPLLYLAPHFGNFILRRNDLFRKTHIILYSINEIFLEGFVSNYHDRMYCREF